MTIERLRLPLKDDDLQALAGLLVDAVESGAAVSFLPPLTIDRAADWWRETLTRADSRSVILIARDDDGIAGSVQLHPAWAPNQPHRADVAKLIVHRRARRTGLGVRLMQGIEEVGRESGFRLLTLDTKRGDAAEHLYTRLGWIRVGSIPNYAFDADGTAHDTVIFYREL